MPAIPIGMILINLAIGVGVMMVGMMLAGKQKSETNFQQMDNPTASGGRTINKIFGKVIVKSPNVLWYGDKTTVKREIKSGGGK